MTAFGSSSVKGDLFTTTCELKSVNSRFLETNIKIPRQHQRLETKLIKLIKGKLARGKVDLFIRISSDSGTDNLPKLNEKAAVHYASLIDRLQEAMQNSVVSSFATLTDPTACEMFALDGVLESSDELHGDELATLEEQLLTTLDKSLEILVESRKEEGSLIGKALYSLSSELRGHIKTIEKEVPRLREHLKQKATERLNTLVEEIFGKDGKPSLSEDRLATELAVLIDKTDIKEEIDRLYAHLETFQGQLCVDTPTGRKLDFICQELHREINTVSSKLSDPQITPCVLECKQIIEQIRQQVQNIE